MNVHFKSKMEKVSIVIKGFEPNQRKNIHSYFQLLLRNIGVSFVHWEEQDYPFLRENGGPVIKIYIIERKIVPRHEAYINRAVEGIKNELTDNGDVQLSPVETLGPERTFDIAFV